MENEIIKLVVAQGAFAVFFAYLLFYVLRENSKREGQYQNIIKELAEKLNVIEDVKKAVDKIEGKLDG
ncbi:bacteriocin [Clostridium botulinum]|uniref:Bacteriocin UviB n=1 Tax=Clostridium botulinum (strain Hall / ATCC 3502 / NCTC 13319 / Type A) TaxID=441771 RepID=A5I1Q3_CLOBH|nr:BhlA/UviB family holin-like peptide [Clostridium botulinum]EPS47524.1 bacteriocin uviB precursor [Clostridium botulinum CFSAN002367]ABS35362.1 bacteriocin UviB [Clostridium botulinum A str. ATCC 19397]ABS36209.1 bacteriocin UviB [Clostridium botulinum A str. Hall]APH21562.1 hypothetical protein NPD1_2808 [Clostridium botulinum]APQ68474.1 hypothetical protein RSJ8_934 [Clostridium botulinum]